MIHFNVGKQEAQIDANGRTTPSHARQTTQLFQLVPSTPTSQSGCFGFLHPSRTRKDPLSDWSVGFSSERCAEGSPTFDANASITPPKVTSRERGAGAGEEVRGVGEGM